MKQKTSSKMVVLLSSGLDSTYNLFKAHQLGQVVLALTFDYGQRAAEKEKIYSSRLCKKLNIPHQIVVLDFFKQFESSSLLNTSKEVPTGGQIQMENTKASQDSAKSVWVPNRNGIFLNIGAGFAEAHEAEWVVPGFNREEAATFPDNSEEYIEKLNGSFQLSTANGVQVKCFSATKNKQEIVKECMGMGVDFQEIWPCYFANESLCESCESCQRFFRALELNGVRLNDL